MSDPVRSVVGGPPLTPAGMIRITCLASLQGSVSSQMRREGRGAEFIHTDDGWTGDHRHWVGGGRRRWCRAQHSVLLILVVRIGRGILRFDGLETRCPPHAVVCVVLRGVCRRPPLAEQVVGKFRRAPGGERQAVVFGAGQSNLGDRRVLTWVNFRGLPPTYFGVRESNPSVLKA